MGRFEYAFVRLNEGLYDEDVRECLGALLDAGVQRGLGGQQILDAFVASGFAREFEYQNPGFVAGRSGVELLALMCEVQGMRLDLSDVQVCLVSRDYWVGYMLGYFQLRMGWTYARILQCVRYDELLQMHAWCQELSEDEFVQELLKQMEAKGRPSALARQRRLAGLTQTQLAQRTVVSLRAIQQYEQGVKHLGHAAAETVRSLALVLGCPMEDLLGER